MCNTETLGKDAVIWFKSDSWCAGDEFYNDREYILQRNTPVLLDDALNHMLKTDLYLFVIFIHARQF